MLSLEGRRKELMAQIMRAQDLDASDKLKEALKQYLVCLKTLADQLLLECHLPEFVSNEKNKQNLELCALCSGRLKLIFDKLREQRINTMIRKPTELDEDPVRQAMEVNKKIIQRHKKLQVTNTALNNKSSIEKNLSLQRRLAENICVAKNHQKMIEKKKNEKELKYISQTEKRFKNRSSNDAHEIMRKKIFCEILKFENEDPLFKEFRLLSPATCRNSSFVIRLFSTVMNTAEHPLKTYVQGEQFRMRFEIKKLTDQTPQFTTAKGGSNTDIENNNNNNDKIISSGDENNNYIENININNNKKDVCCSSGDDFYERANSSNEITALVQEVKFSFQNCTQMFFLAYDHIFEDENDTEDDDDAGKRKKVRQKNDKNKNREGSDEDELRRRRQEVKRVVELEMQQVYYRSIWDSLRDLFKRFNYESWHRINEVMERFKDHVDLDYFKVKESLKLSEGRDLVGGVEKGACEKGLSEEEQLEDGTALVPKDIELDSGEGRVKWIKGTNEIPYSSVIKLLVNASKADPLQPKVNIFLSSMHQICKEVDEYYARKNQLAPGIGADELLPLISYTLVKSREPAIYLDCCILMELLDENQSIGEEGYCITTLVTSMEQWAIAMKPPK